MKPFEKGVFDIHKTNKWIFGIIIFAIIIIATLICELIYEVSNKFEIAFIFFSLFAIGICLLFNYLNFYFKEDTCKDYNNELINIIDNDKNIRYKLDEIEKIIKGFNYFDVTGKQKCNILCN
jgi:hypothetical protein